MITFSTDADKFIREFKAVAREFPKEADKAIGNAASIIKRQVASAFLKGGSPITGTLAARSEIAKFLNPGNFGGKVTRIKPFFIKRLGEYSRAIAPMDWARTFIDGLQNGNPNLLANRQDTLKLHARLGAKDAPLSLHRIVKEGNGFSPDRPVIPPIARNASEKFPEWINGALNKILARNIR